VGAPATATITPLVPLTILGPDGRPVRVDSSSGFMYLGPDGGDGSTPPEQFYAYAAGNLGSTAPILPGDAIVLKSAQTGMYCRLSSLSQTGRRRLQQAPQLPPGCSASQGMVCDQSSPEGATAMVYTGAGLEYNGTPLVPLAGSGVLVLSSDAACTAPGGGTFTFKPVGELAVGCMPCHKLCVWVS